MSLARRSNVLLVMSFIAATTACSRRVGLEERGSPTPSASAKKQPRDPAQDAPSHLEPGGAALPAPSLPLPGNGLKHVTAEELFSMLRAARRKGTLINVWATWCGPCREELPMLAKVGRTYISRGIAIVPLSVDEPEGQSKISAMLRGFGFEPPYYVAKPPIEAFKAALFEGWPGNIPVSFLLDAGAKRRYFFNAEVYEEELTPKLDAFINGTLPVGQSNFGVAAGRELD